MNRKQSQHSKNKAVRVVDRNRASNSTLSCIINTFISAESLVLSPGNHKNFNTLLGNKTENASLHTHNNFLSQICSNFMLVLHLHPQHLLLKLMERKCRKHHLYLLHHSSSGTHLKESRSNSTGLLTLPGSQPKDFIGVLPHIL